MTLNDKLKTDILAAINESGASLPENARARQVINGNLSSVINRTSGQTKFNHSIVSRFKLQLSMPKILQFFNPLEIRCLLCNKVISYPCWYLDLKYTVNHFHYFVCFDSGDKPNTNCLKG
jgi:hypothetical protein